MATKRITHAVLATATSAALVATSATAANANTFGDDCAKRAIVNCEGMSVFSSISSFCTDLFGGFLGAGGWASGFIGGMIGGGGIIGGWEKIVKKPVNPGGGGGPDVFPDKGKKKGGDKGKKKDGTKKPQPKPTKKVKPNPAPTKKRPPSTSR